MHVRKQIHRLVLAATSLTVTWNSAAEADEPKVVLATETLGVAVDRSLSLESGANPAVDNAALLNTSFADAGQRYGVYFPGDRWDFTATPTPSRTARAFVGNGLHRPSAAMSASATLGTASRLYWAGGVTTFDGATVSAHAGDLVGASDVIKLDNRDVLTGDARWTLHITGGTGMIPGIYSIIGVDVDADTWTLDRPTTASITHDGETVTASTAGASATITLSAGAPAVSSSQIGWTVRIDDPDDPDYKFIPGIYVIQSVDVGNKQWTLDRVCSTAAATELIGLATAPGSAMTGTLKATLWRDAGFGNSYKGLYFQGRTSFSGDPDESSRAAIGWHQLHNTGSLNTGKATLENCAFADFDVAILFGAGLGRFGEKANNFPGETVNHADHSSMRKVWVQGCDCAYAIRTNQSVGHNVKDFRIANCNTGFYLERGGQFSAEDVTVSGFVDGTGPTLLRLGKQTSNNCQVRISDFNFDASDPDFKVLEMDGTGNTFGIVTFEQGIVDSNIDYNVPIFTVKDGWKLVIDGFRPLKAGSIKIEAGGAGYIPHVVVMNSVLSGVTNQEDVIASGSASGAKVDFLGNSNFNNSTVFEAEQYVVP